jgi:glycosyltransferase involved in cell wall biosynthesis
MLDRSLEGKGLITELMVVDDGSLVSYEESDFEFRSYRNIDRITLIQLKRNLGHQRAIALGLAVASVERRCDAVVVMDGDGEDDPAEAMRLIDRCREESFKKIVFGNRAIRSEGIVFRFFYSIYRLFYKILTGKPIRVGNFSVVPRTALNRLLVVSEVWNHYAAAILKARLPYTEVNTRRGSRLSGKPKMNFVSLVIHGLSAISVHGDAVGVRLLIGTSIVMVLSFVGILIVFLIRLVTDLAIPGWATYATAMLLIILMQALTLSLFFIFLVLNNRDNASFIPERDYQQFISDIRDITVR